MRWPMDGLVAWTLSWFWHGCAGQWMGWQHGRYHDLGMDALAHAWINRYSILVWAWMRWPREGLAGWTWHDADLSDRESGANEGDLP